MKGIFVVLLLSLGLSSSLAQLTDPLAFNILSSGIKIERGSKSNEALISSEGASWIRLSFSRRTNSPLIKITSLLDGAVQHLNPTTLAQWQFTSAYFNGDSVLVEIPDEIPSTVKAFVEVETFQAGIPVPTPKSICNPSDTRELSTFKRSGRFIGGGGCTAWLIDDKRGCFLTAHHCGTDSNGGGVVEFEVPFSEPTLIGHEIIHPPPEHQYALDPESLIRAQGSVGIGNDWQYFGCFPNTETGFTPFERQQDRYILSTNFTVPSEGEDIRIIGYGVVEFDQPKEWNQVQKVARGPFGYDNKQTNKWSIHYTVDTTGGDSGSAVEQGGYAIGVHTHGGCSRVFGGVNSGTFIGLDSLQAALANPKGVCA